MSNFAQKLDEYGNVDVGIQSGSESKTKRPIT